ncbi:hypothetical protein [Tahibacter caeni]|uniref:hypothetical protein n=1 Tax=Tahibacter caeni TaxID=1453545 RepID=UPI00214763D4|nr:hypothetical protein [Tahibacter caeni]
MYAGVASAAAGTDAVAIRRRREHNLLRRSAADAALAGVRVIPGRVGERIGMKQTAGRLLRRNRIAPCAAQLLCFVQKFHK